MSIVIGYLLLGALGGVFGFLACEIALLRRELRDWRLELRDWRHELPNSGTRVVEE